MLNSNHKVFLSKIPVVARLLLRPGDSNLTLCNRLRNNTLAELTHHTPMVVPTVVMLSILPLAWGAVAQASRSCSTQYRQYYSLLLLVEMGSCCSSFCGHTLTNAGLRSCLTRSVPLSQRWIRLFVTAKRACRDTHAVHTVVRYYAVQSCHLPARHRLSAHCANGADMDESPLHASWGSFLSFFSPPDQLTTFSYRTVGKYWFLTGQLEARQPSLLLVALFLLWNFFSTGSCNRRRPCNTKEQPRTRPHWPSTRTPRGLNHQQHSSVL